MLAEFKRVTFKSNPEMEREERASEENKKKTSFDCCGGDFPSKLCNETHRHAFSWETKRMPCTPQPTNCLSQPVFLITCFAAEVDAIAHPTARQSRLGDL